MEVKIPAKKNFTQNLLSSDIINENRERFEASPQIPGENLICRTDCPAINGG